MFVLFYFMTDYLGPSISSLASVDKYIRLRAFIKARIDRLTKYFVYSLDKDSRYLVVFNRQIRFLNLLLDRLDINNLISNSSYRVVANRWSKYPKTIEEHCIRLFGKYSPRKFDIRLVLNNYRSSIEYYESNRPQDPKLSELRKKAQEEADRVQCIEGLLKTLKVAGEESRRTDLVRRLLIEVESRAKEGWYFVFNTLTVEDGFLGRVFPLPQNLTGLKSPKKAQENLWNDYVRTIDRYFAGPGMFRVRRRSKEEYHSYFASVERGALTGRLHIHVLHCIKYLPDKCADPNFGTIQPLKREIDDLKKFWKYGTSVPIAVRYSSFDAFGLKGWIMPVKCGNCVSRCQCDKPVYVTIPKKPAFAVAFYVAKYISKAYNIRKKGDYIWRVRMSRNLGTSQIQRQMKLMPQSLLVKIVESPNLKIPYLSTKLPKRSKNRIALKVISKSILVDYYRKALRMPVINLLKRISAMTRGIQEYSLRSVGHLMMSSIEIMDVFSYFPVSRVYSVVV